jgi:hypothetical protein
MLNPASCHKRGNPAKPFLYLVGLAVMGLLPAGAGAQTVDEILARHIEARGGLEKIKAVRSIRVSGRANAGPGRDAIVIREIKRPGRIRTEFTIQGMTGVYAFDGERGFEVSPFLGRMDPEPMSPQSALQAEQQADIDGPLVDWKAKGHAVALAGRDTVEGRVAYRLELTLADGTVRHESIDAESYLLVRTESTRRVRGHERSIVTTFGDYRDVEGLFFAHEIVASAANAARRLKVVVEGVELNPTLDEARFRMPKATPPR